PGIATVRIGSAERVTSGGMMFGKSKDDSGLPGPGMYEPKSSLGGPKFVIGGDKRYKDTNTMSPGPGAYDAKDELAKAHGPSFKMGTNGKNGGNRSVISGH